MISPLFMEISPEDLKAYFQREGVEERKLSPGTVLFEQGAPTKDMVFVLLKGSVQVERLTPMGRRTIVNRFTRPGTVFGEVYLYLNHRSYDYRCITVKGAQILAIPKEAMNPAKGPVGTKLCYNMLHILSNKAYFLNERLQIQSADSLRKKIALYLLKLAKEQDSHQVSLSLTREELADFLAVARPSLSRELSKMRDDGLLEMRGKQFTLHLKALEEAAYFS
ncbi:MAG: Crp/Fnr family transcriptional regulator [Tissierellia bacterium]|nr:Crp/Fnr family transcriptional regulator [Tissierellia bacterium]